MDNAAGWSSHTLIAIAFAAIAVASGVCAGFDSARVLDEHRAPAANDVALLDRHHV